MTDFEVHNAEVREVWETYGTGDPIRVPMVLGINPRFTMFDHEANPRQTEFRQYFEDPEAMLIRQLEHASWVRHHIRQDAEMGPPADGWDVRVDFQNAYEAAWLGCDVRFFDGEVPDTQPMLQDDSRKWELIEKGPPDPFADGLMARNWEFADLFLRKQEEGFEWEGKPIASVTPAGPGTDGPLTVACNLRGAAEFFCDLAGDPKYAHALLNYITESSIARIIGYRGRLGQPLKTTGFGLADDAIQSISVPMYREMVLPFHRRLVEELSEGGPNSMHLCGDSARHFLTVRDELNVASFDTGFPIDFGEIREMLGPDVEIKGGPTVMLLQDASPLEVKEDVARILESGVTDGGRFVLREANNLPPGIPPDNLHAMYDAVRDLGEYGADRP